MRKEFFESFKATKQNIDKVIKFVGVTRKIDDWNEYDVSELCRLMDVEYSDDEELDIDDIICKVKECFDKNALQALYLQAYLCLDDNKNRQCFRTYDCEYLEYSTLNIIYTGLEILGYELSDEEERYINGTHELFVKE